MAAESESKGNDRPQPLTANLLCQALSNRICLREESFKPGCHAACEKLAIAISNALEIQIHTNGDFLLMEGGTQLDTEPLCEALGSFGNRHESIVLNSITTPILRKGIKYILEEIINKLNKTSDRNGNYKLGESFGEPVVFKCGVQCTLDHLEDRLRLRNKLRVDVDVRPATLDELATWWLGCRLWLNAFYFFSPSPKAKTDSDEAVQEFWMRDYMNVIENFDDSKGRFVTYAEQSFRHTVSQIKRHNKVRTASIDAMRDEDGYDIPDPTTLPDAINEQEKRELLGQHLSDLRDDEGEIMARLLEGASYKDIANERGKSEGAIRLTKHRVMQLLRKKIRESNDND